MNINTIKVVLATLVLSITAFANAGIITQAEYDTLSETVDFNLLAEAELLSSQYNSQGVIFSGQIAGQTSGDGVFSSTSANTFYTPNRTDEWTAVFSSSINSVGFFAEFWQADTIKLEVFDQGNYVTEYNFNKQNNNIFDTDLIGITETNSFNEIRFSISGTNNNFFNMDDFKFSAPTQEVPEPSTLAIFALGMMGLASRKFKKQA